MAPRKRGRDEMESSEPPRETASLLEKLRNMWEFACVMQFIFTFGKVVKIDDEFDIEDFETACLDPGSSEKLEEIGLTLLKWISSHRGLTLGNWDEYTRRQYLAKAPLLNPYGTEDEPRRFRIFDIFQKIRVLHQLTLWTFWNPDRIRERMPEQREADQTLWRIEELGWDRHDRSYFVLDDSRLYRRTEPPLPTASKAKPKSNTLKAQAARRRASKRRKLEASETPEPQDKAMNVVDDSKVEDAMNDDQADTFGGFKWECIAITGQQYQEFLSTINKSRDPNEKDLYLRIVEHVIPVVQKAEESHRRKMERKQKELLNLQKLTGAKRSSRLADKFERERQERDAVEAAGKHAAELAAAHREEERQARMEQDRQSRMMTREQRIKDREYRRLLHEEKLAEVAEEAKRVEAGEARGSERHLKAQMEKHKRDLEDLSVAEDWVFDCSGCGAYGQNLDDGQHSVACEKCNVWQHSKCLGIRQVEAEKEDFHFVCKDCRQKMEDAKRPNIKLKFRAGLSSSPPQARRDTTQDECLPLTRFKAVEISAHQNHDASSPNHNDHALIPPSSPSKVVNGAVPSPNLLHATSRMSNGHLEDPTAAISPTRSRPSASNHVNGYQAPHTRYPYPSNPPFQQGHVSSYAKRHTPSSSPPQRQDYRDERPGSSYGDRSPAHSTRDMPQDINQHPHYPNIHSTPQAQPILRHGPQSAQESNPQAPGRLPSPIINRPSMSPTQGNPDVGPVAGVRQHSSTGTTSLSSHPLQASTRPSKHEPAAAPSAGSPHGLFNVYQNGYSDAEVTTHHSGHYKQPPQPLSGLSPTKHSPNVSFTGPTTTAPNASFSATSRPSTTTASRRSISGTPVFPPAEMLQPSPRQLSRSPVPTPSKTVVPGRVRDGAGEKVGDETRGEMEEVGGGVGVGGR